MSALLGLISVAPIIAVFLALIKLLGKRLDAHFELPDLEGLELLIVRSFGDEAAAALAFFQFITWLINRTWIFFDAIVQLVYIYSIPWTDAAGNFVGRHWRALLAGAVLGYGTSATAYLVWLPVLETRLEPGDLFEIILLMTVLALVGDGCILVLMSPWVLARSHIVLATVGAAVLFPFFIALAPILFLSYGFDGIVARLALVSALRCSVRRHRATLAGVDARVLLGTVRLA